MTIKRPYISLEIRQRVRETSRYHCGYCQTQEINVGPTLHIEHIIPLSKGGSSDQQNLWLACSTCNHHKASRIEALDPQTNVLVPLYNPRTQFWADHCAQHALP